MESLQRAFESPVCFYLALGFFLLVPTLARSVFGATDFTIKLKLVQKLGLGTLCLLFAFLPGVVFSNCPNSANGISDQGACTPVSPWEGRALIAVMGLLMVGLGIRSIVCHRPGTPWEDFDNTPD